MLKRGEVRVRPAVWPGDLPMAQRLFEEYFASLRDDPQVPSSIRSRDRQPELNALGSRYQDDSASLLLACVGDDVLGCASVQWLPSRPHAVEMKRLYVFPEFRGSGVGRVLIEACLDWARRHGAREVLLDTLPLALAGAVRLYRAMGAKAIERYNDNVGPEFAFYSFDLA